MPPDSGRSLGLPRSGSESRKAPRRYVHMMPGPHLRMEILRQEGVQSGL